MIHLLHLKDYTTDDIKHIIHKAIDIKQNQHHYHDALKNKNLIMLFQKGSTRTRLSFEAGMTQLGGHGIFVDQKTTQFAITDYRDEIKAVMRFGDLLMFRAQKYADVQTAADQDMIPVIDACSEKYHPCQALGDLLTMAEHSAGLENIKKVVWLGIENNVSNTLKIACAKLDIDVVLAAPEIDPDSVDEELNTIADKTGHVTKELDIATAVKDADYLHTDTWINMEFFENGEVKPEFQAEYDRRVELFKPYQLNADLVNNHSPEAKIMHCMPCHVGYEITRDAIDHPNSVIFDQAENRMHAQKAAMLYLLGK